MQNNDVRTAIQAFAKRLKCSVQLRQDHQFLYLESNSRFYKIVFEEGFPEVFREFCRVLREFDFIYAPGDRGQILIGSLDILDEKRRENKPIETTPKIEYNEDDVLS